jgi:hypothetical protein
MAKIHIRLLQGGAVIIRDLRLGSGVQDAGNISETVTQERLRG